MLLKLAIMILYWFFSVNLIEAIRCYNCGTSNTDTCENFNPNNSLFIVNCPTKSCGLEIHADKKIRTCEEYFIDDCKKANDIQYCYCTEDLCNGHTIQFRPSDDEDDNEGSGSGTTPLISTTTIIPTTIVISTNSSKTFTSVPKSTNGCHKVIVSFFPLLIIIRLVI